MKKMKGRINMFIIIGLVIILIGLIVFSMGLIRKYAEKHILDGDGMIYEEDIKRFEYDEIDGMNGASYSILIYEGELTVSECKGNGYEEVEQKKPCPTELYVSLNEIVKKYNIKSWTQLEKSDNMALDAPSKHFRFEFKDGLVINVSSDDVWPEGSTQAVSEIIQLVKNY